MKSIKKADENFSNGGMLKKCGLALKGKDKVSGKEIVGKDPGIKCLERDSLVIEQHEVKIKI